MSPFTAGTKDSRYKDLVQTNKGLALTMEVKTASRLEDDLASAHHETSWETTPPGQPPWFPSSPILFTRDGMEEKLIPEKALENSRVLLLPQAASGASSTFPQPPGHFILLTVNFLRAETGLILAVSLPFLGLFSPTHPSGLILKVTSSKNTSL